MGLTRNKGRLACFWKVADPFSTFIVSVWKLGLTERKGLVHGAQQGARARDAQAGASWDGGRGNNSNGVPRAFTLFYPSTVNISSPHHTTEAMLCPFFSIRLRTRCRRESSAPRGLTPQCSLPQKKAALEAGLGPSERCLCPCTRLGSVTGMTKPSPHAPLAETVSFLVT